LFIGLPIIGVIMTCLSILLLGGSAALVVFGVTALGVMAAILAGTSLYDFITNYYIKL